MTARGSRMTATMVLIVWLVGACSASSTDRRPSFGSSVAPASVGPSEADRPSAGCSSLAIPSSVASPSLGAAPSPSVTPVRSVPLAVVTGFSNYRINSVTVGELEARFGAGTLLIPCGAELAVAAALQAGRAAGSPFPSSPPSSPAPSPGSPAPTAPAACVQAGLIPARLDPSSTLVGLLPPGLVTPRVKVVPIGGADLFGERPARSVAYPLAIPVPPGWPASWVAYDATNVRVVVTTGVNCPDRGVSRQTNVFGRGWDWLLTAGTARYVGRVWDRRYGWWVVRAQRNGHEGSVADLIRNADIAESDFECSMTRQFRQHDSGTVFAIDPRVAPLMAKAGFDVATIAADHNTNVGTGSIVETVDLFRANGIQPVGGGRTLAEALRPAVIDVRGVRFGFVGFDAIGGSVSATATRPGVAPLTASTVRKAIAAARAAGADVVVALPQWSSTEYRAAFTPFQRGLIGLLERAGADHIVGADFHWAGAISITPGGASGYRFVSASQGNFWFGQDWSRQTQEGIITTLTFVGSQLVQVRLVPTVVLDDAQPNLTDPSTDGRFVLHQVLSVSTLLDR